MFDYDTNGDCAINLGDESKIDASTLGLLAEMCETDGNLSISMCELFHCMIEVENAYRRDNCPYYGDIHCIIPEEGCFRDC
jgi:hypothetical protein